MLKSLSVDRSSSEIARKLAVKVYRIIAKGIVEFNVTLHVAYCEDQTSDGRDNTASAKESVSSLKYGVFRWRDSQNAESEDAACPNLLCRAHVEVPDERRGKAEDANIKYNIRYA